MANNTGKKYGGREAGTPNRLTSELRAILKGIVYDELQKLPEALAELPKKDRIDVTLKLLNYVCPKVKDIKYNIGEPLLLDMSVY
jgi:hypothetical protein